MELMKCNKSDVCTYHQRHNCPHGEPHTEIIGCRMKCADFDDSAACEPLEIIALNPAKAKRDKSNHDHTKYNYIRQYGVITESSIGTALFRLNEKCKTLEDVQMHGVIDLDPISKDFTLINIFYSHIVKFIKPSTTLIAE